MADDSSFVPPPSLLVGILSRAEWELERVRRIAAASAVPPHLPISDGSRVEYGGVRHDSYHLPDPSCPSHPGFG